MQALEQGNIDTNKKTPEFEIFTNERYRECRVFLQNWNPVREPVEREEGFVAYVPPGLRNHEQKDEAKEIIDDNFSEMSVDDFLNKFNEAKHVKDFLTDKDEKFITNIIIESAEKGNDYFEKLIKFINVINNEIIKLVLVDEDLRDYVSFDAPFTKKKLNEMCAKFKIKKF